MVAHPRHGYPTTTAAILALERKGRDEYQVAAELGLTLGMVRHLKRCRNKLVPRRIGRPKRASKVDIPRDLVGHLERHALRRQITPQDVIRRLLHKAIIDDMVDAILDDGVSFQHPSKKDRAA